MVWPIAAAWYVFDKLVTFKKEESANKSVDTYGSPGAEAG
jgi:hypothetical protein